MPWWGWLAIGFGCGCLLGLGWFLHFAYQFGKSLG